jgi:hypothetical protein
MSDGYGGQQPSVAYPRASPVLRFATSCPPKARFGRLVIIKCSALTDAGGGRRQASDEGRRGRTYPSTSGGRARAACKVPRAGRGGSADASGGILSFCFRLLQRLRSLLRCEVWGFPAATRAEATSCAPKPASCGPRPRPHRIPGKEANPDESSLADGCVDGRWSGVGARVMPGV